MGHVDDFDRAMLKVLAIDPHFGEAYLLRAAQENTERHYEAALTDTFLAEHLDPGLTWAKVVRAGALNSLHRFADAWAVLETLDWAEAQTWEAKYERTRTALGRGDLPGSLRWSAETLKAAPSFELDSALVLRGNALQQAGRYAEAIPFWREYLASPRRQVYRQQVLAKLAMNLRLVGPAQATNLGAH